MNKLDVYYENRIVGTLALQNNKVYFQYANEWISNGFSISPISLPLEKKLFVVSNDNFNGLFGVFADSLPDAWGQLILNRYLNKYKKNKTFNVLDQLSIIGESGMGGLEYKPSMENTSKDEVFDLSLYQKEANKILNEKDCDNINMLFQYGGSSGGARPKALVNINGESYIIKFQSRYDIDNVGTMEYEYACACKECGINMPYFKLLKDDEDNSYFAIKRFDRDENKKIHMISVAAILEADFRSPCLDYNELFRLTSYLTNNNEEELYELFRRMCFNVHAHNLDDHIKNFSFLYNEKLHRYDLSPAYDMTYSNTYYGEHTTSVNGKGINILDEDLYIIGKKAGLKLEKLKEINENIKMVVNSKLKKYIG